jgi:serine/threonine-protein kinase
MIGKTVGKYRIVDRLGRGGMGTVYKAVDETLDREVAIKVLNPDLGDTDVMKRFRAEAVTLARLNHPGIATLYELHRDQDDLLMVMEYVRGETFHDVSERLGPLAPPQAAYLCVQVLDALAHAHRAGVVHRDLKPANLMVADTGGVKVMDFGIARVLGAEHFTYGGYMMGTPAFMAPEQVLGRDVDGRSDLYAVGVVFYRLISGQLPFDADTAIAIAQKQVSDPPTPVTAHCPDLPAWCGEVIDRALAKSPQARFQSAEEFRAALVSVVQPQTLGELPTMATPTPPGLPRSTGTLSANDVTRAAAVATATGGARATRTGPGVAIATPPGQVTPVCSTSAVTPGGVPSPATGSQPAAGPATTTVVLGRTHLAALAALFLVLAGGIAVLGFAALKRASFPQQLPLLGTLPEAPSQAADSSSPSGTPAEPPAAVEGPDTGQAGSSSATTGVAATVGAGAPSLSAAPPKTAPRPPASPLPPAPDDAAAIAARETASPPPPIKAAASVPVLTFDDVRLLVTGADNKGREREAVLELGSNGLMVFPRQGGASIASVSYKDVAGAYYSRSRQPKWLDHSGKEIEGRVDQGAFGFFRGDRNWLILLTAKDPVIFRVEDSSLQQVLAAVEERVGVAIRR